MRPGDPLHFWLVNIFAIVKSILTHSSLFLLKSLNFTLLTPTQCPPVVKRDPDMPQISHMPTMTTSTAITAKWLYTAYVAIRGPNESNYSKSLKITQNGPFCPFLAEFGPFCPWGALMNEIQLLNEPYSVNNEHFANKHHIINEFGSGKSICPILRSTCSHCG